MNLDFFNQLANKIEENEGIKEFINDLASFLQNAMKQGSDNMDMIEKIQQENKVSLISKNKMRNEKSKIIQSYAQEENLYFVTKAKNEEGTFRVEKYDDKNRMEVLDLALPKETRINSVMKEKNGEYILDNELTQEIKNEIESMAHQILEEQEQELIDYRKEGHKYLVTEDTNGRIYLSDQTENRGFEVEEVELPEVLKKEVVEGTILKYEDNHYTIIEE